MYRNRLMVEGPSPFSYAVGSGSNQDRPETRSTGGGLNKNQALEAGGCVPS
jgi:hypothetical protein